MRKPHVPRQALQSLPFLIYVGLFLRFTRNVPFADDYDVILRWLTQFRAQRQAADVLPLLLQQHNEHRMLFERLVVLLQFALCRRVNFIQLAAFGSLGLWLIVCLFQRRLAPSAAWLAPAFAVLLLNLSQYELVSFATASLQQYWQLLACLWTLLLVADRGTRAWLPLSLLAAVAATFTGAGGLLVFLVAPLILARRRDWGAVSAWLLVAGATCALYFVLLPYEPTPIQTASRQIALAHPLEVLRYVVLFLGSALGNTQSAGIAGVVLLVASLAVLLRAMIAGFSFEAAAVLFVLGSAVVVAVGRISLGVEQALASRYTIYSLVLMCSLLGYALRLGPYPAAPARAVSVMVYALGLWLFAYTAPQALRLLAQRSAAMEVAVLYPQPARAVAILRAGMRQGLYWPPARVYAALAAAERAGEVPACLGVVDSIDGAVPSGPLRVKGLGELRGWLALRGAQGLRPAGTVYVTLLDTRTHSLRLLRTQRLDRPDVGRALRDPRLGAAGFIARVQPGALHGAFHLGLAFVENGQLHRCAEPDDLVMID
ncbi:hypothetical protein [Thiomonas sp. FB-6]|uniref:hypothetical protein n=1 Tax=Thiomonas sp. FB-6 TaxID=1158291 RepID=UPI000360A351|nr:hypothetical protein [Thiomonas sp. FB-6]